MADDRPTGQPEVYRITGAVRPHSDDLEQRMGRYLVSMLIRTVCVILVLVVPGPARWLFAVGAVFLPYVAVILANTGHTRRDTALPTVSSGTIREAIAPTPVVPVPERAPTGRDSARGSGDQGPDSDILVGEIVPPTAPHTPAGVPTPKASSPDAAA